MTVRLIDNELLSENEGLREVKKYLKGYSVFRRIIDKKTESIKCFGNPRNCDIDRKNVGEAYELVAVARVKSFEIRRFVSSLPSGDEKVFIFLHYIHGESMESCAERLGISYRQVFRLKKSALALAQRRFLKWRLERAKCVE